MKNLTNLIIALFTMIALSGCGEQYDTKDDTTAVTGTIIVTDTLAQLSYKYSNMTDVDVETAMSHINNLRTTGVMCGENWFEPVAPLTWDENLSKSASIKDADMIGADYFAHELSPGLLQQLEKFGKSPDFSRLIKTIANSDRPNTGENISAGQDDMGAAMVAWEKSPTHCKNMMNPSFTKVGFDKSAASGSYYGRYYTTHFSD